MCPDSFTRFSGRVAHYVRYRPGYPREIAALFDLKPGAHVADIGSGTGILSRVFTLAGFQVTGVEPNAEMRAAAEGVHTVEGRAEATALPDSAFDLITAGQAFHWFDPEATKREWRRILKPGCSAALIWNDRALTTPFMRDLELLTDRFAAERDADGAIRERGRSRIPAFFAPREPRIAKFQHRQRFDFEGLRGRMLSSSYLPGEQEAGELTRELRTVFDLHQNEGRIEFQYETVVYWNEL